MNEPIAGSTPAMTVLDSAATRLMAGDRVDVQNRFDGSWSGGFEIAEVLGAPPYWTYRIRRLSDGDVLPRVFDHDSVVESEPSALRSGPPSSTHPSMQPVVAHRWAS